MPDERNGAVGWVRGLFRRGEDGPSLPGQAGRSEARRAIEHAETLLCEAICRADRGPGAPPSVRNAFGKPVESIDVAGAAAALATAAGLTAAGRRTAIFLDATGGPEAGGALAAAARRGLPLVVHLRVGRHGDHAGGHALAETGAFVFFAADAQEAVDLTLVARRVAERALVPGVIVCDGPGAESELHQPTPELARAFVGAPDRTVDTPTPAQAMLFGNRRPVLPRWFDPSRPVAHGVAPDPAVGAAGRNAFFADHLRPILEDAIIDLARLTGRACGLVRRHRIDGATHIVVAQGEAVVRAEQATGGRGKVGVLGISSLHPFPSARVRDALARAETVAVLERGAPPTDPPPLMRATRAALVGLSPRLLSATHAGLTEDDLETVIRNLQAGEGARPILRLGVTSPSVGSPYPKREALLQRIQRDYPDLKSQTADHPERAPRAEGPIRTDDPLPLAVRRFSHLASTYDNVARFWGEYSQPQAGGDASVSVPDPYLAVEAVPACTATFHEAARVRDELPRIDPEACTGCGKCWTLCPHSAVMPLAVPTQALLESLSDPEDGDEAAGKLHRVLRQLSQRLNRDLVRSEAGALEASALDEAFAWLTEQMKVSEEERPGLERAFRAVAEQAVELPLSITQPFFRDGERAKRGGGDLLMVAIDPKACTGCGLCVPACADGALEMEPVSVASVAAAKELMQRWEELPDTPGPTIARLSDDDRVGPLASILLSRHCSQSLPGGDVAEAGSGERLAVRQVTAVVEFEMQRRMVAHLESLDDLARRLRQTIASEMAGAVEVEDLDHLDTALGDLPDRNVKVTEVLERVAEAGEHTDLDAPRVHRLVHAALDLERMRREIAEGPHGAGRARYGVVVAGETVAAWAARFPRNPFGVPLAVDLASHGAEVAAGLARGLLAERVDQARRIRLANLLLEAPADLPVKERALSDLAAADLTREERALCPPLLFLCGADAFGAADLAGISKLLASELPVKLVLLDGHDLTDPLLDPSLLGLAQQHAFVLSASPSHPGHLHRGVSGALTWTGPALIHLHAPSPGRHGFDPRQTVERAHRAVETRVHPLVRIAPDGGVPDLEGNPALDLAWVVDQDGKTATPASWAAEENRFASCFTPVGESNGVPIESWLSKSPDERGASKPTVPGPNGGRLAVGVFMASATAARRGVWRRLQEASGRSGPAAETARERAAEDLRAEHEQALDALRAEYEKKIEEIDRRQLASQAARLRDRVLALAGIGARRADRRRDPS